MWEENSTVPPSEAILGRLVAGGRNIWQAKFERNVAGKLSRCPRAMDLADIRLAALRLGTFFKTKHLSELWTYRLAC